MLASVIGGPKFLRLLTRACVMSTGLPPVKVKAPARRAAGYGKPERRSKLIRESRRGS
jgi:hypothetical protein